MPEKNEKNLSSQKKSFIKNHQTIKIHFSHNSRFFRVFGGPIRFWTFFLSNFDFPKILLEKICFFEKILSKKELKEL